MGCFYKNVTISTGLKHVNNGIIFMVVVFSFRLFLDYSILTLSPITVPLFLCVFVAKIL